MFEKVNPSHPDKIADRIAGAIVDLAYKQQENPKIAVEVLIGHGICQIIAETSVELAHVDIRKIVERIAGNGVDVNFKQVNQNEHLADNQKNGFRCGDNGIFKGMPVTVEQHRLSAIAQEIYENYPTDGKYILADGKLIICQSNSWKEKLKAIYPGATVNPLGDWTGGIEVDSGATNRKLGSDMGDSVTGGGLHGKDLSKADISVNIYAWMLAQKESEPVEIFCAIGDKEFPVYIDGTKIGTVSFEKCVNEARNFINKVGGFEKFAEWGLI